MEQFLEYEYAAVLGSLTDYFQDVTWHPGSPDLVCKTAVRCMLFPISKTGLITYELTNYKLRTAIAEKRDPKATVEAGTRN